MVDGRTPEELLEQIERIAPAYTDQWDPTSRDVGWTVAERFAELAGIVVDRIDRVPAKHRVGFYDALGFEQAPPQAARLPLTAQLVEDLEENVQIPPRTRATASGENGDPEQEFEILPGDAFEATPAQLQRVYSVAPDKDAVFEHATALDAGEETRLFYGDNEQTHVLSLGHTDRLNLTGGTTVWIAWTPSVSKSDLDALLWEYFEERDSDEPGEHWHAFDDVENHSLVGGVLTVIDVPEDDETEREFTETDVGGVTSRWLRCRVDPKARSTLRERLLGLTVGDLALLVGARTSEPSRGTGRSDALEPDHLLVNGAPVPTSLTNDDSVSPFGPTPITGETFAIASEEAFTKHGSAVELAVKVSSSVTATEPEILWQYWNGSSWALLDEWEYFDHLSSTWVTVDDATGSDKEQAESVLRLRADGRVRFTVPDNLQPTTVSGHEGYWIRARVMESEFGKVTYTMTGSGDGSAEDPKIETWTVDAVNPAASELVSLSLAYGEKPLSALLEAAKRNRDGIGVVLQGTDATAPTHLVTTNGLADTVHPGEVTAGFRPFVPLPDETQALYVGVDAPLRGGPIHVFVSPTDRTFPESFIPDVRWEYWNGTGWSPADVRDETEGLTERGIVRLTFPTPTTARAIFGWEGHWVRARVAGQQFDPDADATSGPSTDGHKMVGNVTDDSCPPLCTDTGRLETAPPAGRPTKAPPTLKVVALNTGWAVNVRTVTEERLDTSDGTPDQTVVVSSTPVVDATLWVDELPALSDADRQRLAMERPDAVRPVTAAAAGTGPTAAVAADDVSLEGELDAFWVQWEAVPDFLASTATDRHYTIDRLDGHISFGDGVAGAIPPRGQPIVATYETGGGSAGNVAAGAVTELRNAIALVDSVTNLEAADGGADAEATDAVVERAPRELRDRNRAVAPADFERLALASSRRLARARCLPRMDEAGDSRLGWVTVLIVPSSDDVRPTPTAELRAHVETELAAHAPLTLLAPESRLVVRGPSYVSVSVETTLASNVGERVSVLEERASAALTAFLHPLTGDNGEGWPFGTLPCVSDLLAVLERVDGVDHVESVMVTYTGSAAPVTIGEGEDPPSVEPDTLVHSGTHTVTIHPVRGSSVGAESGASAGTGSGGV
jgi:uncharacterized phage protein gp47/JayE